MVATDHAPFDFKTQKPMGKADFTKIPNGIPSLEERVNLLYTHGVAAGRIDLHTFVNVASTAVAKQFDLFPRKGAIQPGADADLVVFDPKYRGKISVKTQHMAVDYSAFEGWPLKGRASVVTVRGQVAARDGKFTGTLGRGHDPFAVDGDGFERTLDLNLTSVWWASTAALPTMRRQGNGAIISVGSGAAIRASAGVAYVAAKHGMVGLTKALASQAAASGITVNMLSPGWTDTSLVDFERIAERTGTTPEAARESAEAESAQRRILDPAELTGMAVLLASAEGRGITGQDLHVDGGYRL